MENLFGNVIEEVTKNFKCTKEKHVFIYGRKRGQCAHCKNIVYNIGICKWCNMKICKNDVETLFDYG